MQEDKPVTANPKQARGNALDGPSMVAKPQVGALGIGCHAAALPLGPHEFPARQEGAKQPVPKERVERDEEDLVRLYLTDIGQYPLLTKDDEVRLAQTIEAGTAARAEL
ncbi:MAG: hypothetical protein LC792_27920, partial [Actinobacteria bacterium]|nr:hypothetical protein [Actinomycetota bacterium]